MQSTSRGTRNSRDSKKDRSGCLTGSLFQQLGDCGRSATMPSSKDRRTSLFGALALRFAPRELPCRSACRMIVRRYSSPILSTNWDTCAAEDADSGTIADCESNRLNVASNLGKRRLLDEEELVSRSCSLRLGDGDSYESFCPSDFETKELLGKGFYGEAFKVIHRKSGQIMVLKRLYRINSRGEQDFVKEAAVMRRLHHPNVLRFMGILYKDRQLHLVTEYVSGGTLRQRLDSSDVLPWTSRVSVAKDVASGMAYLHSKNIIHRDLNSGNILIREEDSSAVVADFGLARIVGRRRFEKRRRLTVVGNPYLMAPEMSKELNYNELVDVFSYGVTLCEIIGRCSSDPDILNRLNDFGIDQQSFIVQFVSDSCPRDFLDLAFQCAAVDANARPSFDVIEQRLERMLEALLEQGDCADAERMECNEQMKIDDKPQIELAQIGESSGTDERSDMRMDECEQNQQSNQIGTDEPSEIDQPAIKMDVDQKPESKLPEIIDSGCSTKVNRTSSSPRRLSALFGLLKKHWSASSVWYTADASPGECCHQVDASCAGVK